MTRSIRPRLAALAALALVASCSLEDQTVGPAAAPSGGPMFTRYGAIGTSITAGIQSGGINDSTQREGFAAQLAGAMGLTPGVDWIYPSFRMPGCPGPFVNPLANQRVGGGSGTACLARATGSIRDVTNNVGIPFLRAQQALDIQALPFPVTDTLKLAAFITGSISPAAMMYKLRPTFMTLEVGSNDVLHAATRGDTNLLTPLATFTATLTALADTLDQLVPQPNIAITNVANITTIPFLTRGSVLFGIVATVCPQAGNPYCSPLFTVDASCAPTAIGGVGDNYLLSFNALGAITSTLAAGRAAKVDCGRDSALVATAAAPAPATAGAGPTVTPAELTAINTRVAAFNTHIASIAARTNYALVDFAAALQAQVTAGNIPPIPNFATPSGALFGTLFSLDGVHPTRAGHKVIANTFIAAINAKGWASLTPIP